MSSKALQRGFGALMQTVYSDHRVAQRREKFREIHRIKSKHSDKSEVP